MWFGKKAAEDAVKGVGNWIDEQQFTPEEQVKYKLQLFEVMGPFKQIQRIIVTWVMHVWAGWSLLLGLSLVGGAMFDNYSMFDKALELITIPFVWTPCLGVFTLYLSGGLKNFGGKK